MWHFIDLICAIHVETENNSLLLKFPLLKKWHFLDIISLVYDEPLQLGFAIVTGHSSKSGILWTLQVQDMLKLRIEV